MTAEYIGALFLIFAAEMGDKTQILAMMFATKYKVRYVLAGIFIGSFLNHGLAVVFGRALGRFIQPSVLQMIAGVAFIAFAIWTLFANEDDEDAVVEEKKIKGAIGTVAAAFFIGELGDKTQLTAITLAVDAVYPMWILLGTVSGMLVTSSLGIFVGSKIGDRIPELGIKLGSSGIFLFFGVVKLVTSTPESWKNIYVISVFFIGLILVVGYLMYRLMQGLKSGELTPLRKAAKTLYTFNHQFEQAIKVTCHGKEACQGCEKNHCGIGLMKHILNEISEGCLEHKHDMLVSELHLEKNKFTEEQLKCLYEMTVEFENNYKQEDLVKAEVKTIQEIITRMMEENNA